MVLPPLLRSPLNSKVPTSQVPKTEISRRKPALRVDTSVTDRDSGPSSTNSGMTEVSLLSSGSSSGEVSTRPTRKRKSPRKDTVMTLLIDHPDVDLDGLIALLGEDAETHLRSSLTRLLNLRLMPVMYMDVIETMLRANPYTRAVDISRRISSRLGKAPAFWITLWIQNCYNKDNINECLSLERRKITLDDNSRIECFYMDTMRWSYILNHQGYRLEQRGGVDLEIYVSVLDRMETIPDRRPSSRMVVTPDLPDADISEIIVVQLQGNLEIQPVAILDIIQRAGGQTDISTVQRLYDSIWRKFFAPFWLHNHLLMNSEELDEQFFASLDGIVNHEDVSIEKIREWRKFCTDGNGSTLSLRCKDTIDSSTGEVQIELSDSQKLLLLVYLSQKKIYFLFFCSPL